MKTNFQIFTRILFITIGLTLANSAFSETNQIDPAELADFNAYIAHEMGDQDIPALSLMVFDANNIIYEANSGYANLATKNALTSDHVFLMASVSKLITATALMQLFEQGQFKLDDKISDYLPFNIDNPFNQTPITFRMLLTHTSAIADGAAMDGQYYFGQDSPVKLDYFLENYLTKNGKFYDPDDNFYEHKPGSRFEYSNEASALMAVLVEQISGMNFVNYSQTQIFNPLGMDATQWRLDRVKNPIVTPYEDKNNQNSAIKHYTFTDYPNGGLRSNARDMRKFLTMLMLGGKQMTGKTQILNAQTIAQMLTPQIPKLDKTVGLHIFKLEGETGMWGHEGGENGVSTIVGFNPASQIGVIILTNVSDAYLEDMLAEAYFAIGANSLN